MTYKACLFDIDGTIYSHRIQSIPESTQKALWQLKDNGWKLGIATSRCKDETANLPSFYREFPFDAYVYDGGAHVVCGETAVQEKTLPADIMPKLIELQKETGMDLRYSCANGDFSCGRISNWYSDVFFQLYLNFPKIKEYEGEPVYNILIQSEDEAILERVKELVTGCHIVNYHRVLELTPPGVEKSDGIRALAAYWGMSIDEVVCFGDGLNDIDMIKNVGLGVAMGNGRDELKAHAKEVCGHIDEDGLYLFMKEKGFING